MFKIQTAAGNSNYSRYLFEQQWEHMFFEEIPFRPSGQVYYAKNILQSIELLTSVKDWCFGIATKKKHPEENLLESFLYLDSEAFIGYRADKKQKNRRKQKKTKKTKKQSLGRNVVPKGFLQQIGFLVSLFFSFSLKFFGFVFMILWHICLTW